MRMKIPIASIKVDRSRIDTQRFRRAMGDIQKLVESIKHHGLIHPIVVDVLEDGSDHKYILVAGERRLTAVLYLGWSEIDATVLSSLSDLERKEVELEENAQRKDLTWREQIEALRQLDSLKRSIHGTRHPGSISREGWTIKDTADAIGASIGTISQDISLANDLASDPELSLKVARMPKMTARKFVEREKQRKRMKAQIERREIDVSSDLVLGAAEEKIKDLRDGSVHCLITDPPFAVREVDEVANGNLSSKYNQGANVGKEEEMALIYHHLLPELRRVMVDGAHFYMFFGIEWYERLVSAFRKNGFIVHPVPLIWAKHRTTMIPNPYHYIPSYEMILFGCKAPQKRILLKPIANCLMNFPTPAPQKRVHPLQKPIELIKFFIENSTVPGETILDTFAGSGVVLKAAEELGRRGVGFEIDETNYYAAQEFLSRSKR